MIKIEITVNNQADMDQALTALGLMRRPFIGAEPILNVSRSSLTPLPQDEDQSGVKHPSTPMSEAFRPDEPAPAAEPPKPRGRPRKSVPAEPPAATLSEKMTAMAEAQDAADEAAERAANRKTTPDHDDLRHAIGRYFKKFSAPDSIKNIPIILGCGIQDVPQDQIQAQIDKIDSLIASGEPLPTSEKHIATVVTAENGSVVGVKPSADSGLFGDDPKSEPPATKESVIDAIRGYARKYDGDVKSAADAKIAAEDIPKILYEACGKYKVGEIAPDNYAAARAAVIAATLNNPFQRALA